MSKFSRFAVVCAVVACALGAVAGTDYYVRTNGDDGNNGTTPESARATIAAGMALLTGTGDRLLVGPGVYTNSTAFTVNNGMQVIGEEGAEKTCIAIPSNHTLFTFNGTGGGGTVRGFTIAPSAGRVQCCVAQMTGAGLFADCIVRDLGTMSSGFVGLQSSSAAIISNCCFYGCQGGGRDAAVVEQWLDGRIYDCKFIGCSGNNSEYGGTVLVGNGVLRNSLIAFCTNTDMSAGVSFWGTGTVENCTIVNCYSKSPTIASGVQQRNGSPNVVNSIVIGCSNGGGEANMGGSFQSVTYTAAYPKRTGDGNLELKSVDFVDPAAYDFRVASGPTINAGRYAAWMDAASDLAGTNRILQGVVDMGCYEAAPSGIKAVAQPSPISRVGAGVVTLKAVVTAADTDGLTYAWAVTNRTTGVEVLSCAGAQYETVALDCAIGEYDVALVVVNGQGERSEFFGAALFRIKPIDVWVAKGGSATYPYDTRERAFASLADALDFAEDDMTVIVGDGVYTNTAAVALSRAVTVRSEHGREATAFVTKGNYWHWTLNNARARIDGLTLNGLYSGGHAIRLNGGRLDNSTITNYSCQVVIQFDENNVISNCIITCCRSTERDAMVAGSGGGEFRDCAFVDNEFWHNTDYGGITDGYNSNPKFRNCLIARNRFTHDEPSTDYGFVLTLKRAEGLLENCTIVSNRCTNGTKGRVAITHTAGTIRNCIIAFNENENGLADLSTTVPANITHTLVTTANVIDDCEGCFVADPKFKHPSRGDYRLKGDSPAIDRALWEPWMEGAKDLNGGPRLLNKAVDLGCYECPLTGLLLIVK